MFRNIVKQATCSSSYPHWSVSGILGKSVLGTMSLFGLVANTFAVSSDEIADFTPVCIGSAVSFAASTTGVDAQATNPNHEYGALRSAPNPAWFYFKVKDAGTLNIDQTNSATVDVDGAFWGPFDNIPDFLRSGTSPDAYEAALLLDSDYATAAGFSFSTTVEAGKYYVLLIANYSGVATDIAMNSGTGTTATSDCDALNPGFDLTISGGQTSTVENGATDSYTVSLYSQPTDDVTVNISTQNGEVSASPNPLTFGTSDWYIPQTVTLTAVDDALVDGTQAEIIVNTASSLDTNYNLLVRNIPSEALDNDFPPMVTADSASAAADTNVTLALADNISDSNNNQDLTTIDLDQAVSGNQSGLTSNDGVWSVNAAGIVTFNPDSDFEGTSSISYSVENTAGFESNIAAISVTIAGASPIVTAESAVVAADANASIDLADNVSDANNDALLTTIDLDPVTAGIQTTLVTNDGAWIVNAAGSLSFNPDSDFEGTTSIPYTISDDDGNVADPVGVSVSVAGAVPLTTADSTSVSTNSNALVDLSDNFSDANNDVSLSSLDLDPSTAGVQQSLTTAEGVWTVNLVGLLSFDPNTEFEGTASITYTVSDDDANVSAPSTVSISVAGANPVATPVTVNAAADSHSVIDLSANVSDANNDILISTIDLDPSTPGVQSELITADGAWTTSAVGELTFDPAANFQGTASLSYTVSDDDGNVSALASVNISVASAPPIVSAVSVDVEPDASTRVSLLDNATDANNDLDVASFDLDPSTPGVQSTLSTADGEWTVNANGDLSFDPATDYEGTASLPYTVSDASGNLSAPATVSVTVRGATPVVNAVSANVAANAIASIDLSATLSDANNDVDLSTLDLDPSTPGFQTTLSTIDGLWEVDGSGALSFNPNPEFEGTATISYAVSDDDSNVSSAAAISVTVAGATPVVTANSITTAADTLATIDLSDYAADANNDVDLTTIDLDPTMTGVQSHVTTPEGVWTVDAAGLLGFDPAPEFEGTTSIPFTISDDDGNVSAPSSLSVTVAGATPIAIAESGSAGANAGVSIDLSDNISDTNNDVVISTIDLDPVTPGVQSTLSTSEGVWSVNTTGILAFDPNADFEGTTSISYTVSDDDGNISAPAVVGVTIAGAQPIVAAASANVVADTVATIDLSDNVYDANNDVVLVSIDLDPSTPGIQSTMTSPDGVWTVDSVGVLSFDPISSFQGTATIAYTISDDDGNTSAPASVSVLVASASPVASAQVQSTVQNTVTSIDVLNGAADANDDLDTSSIDLGPSTPGIQTTLSIPGVGVYTVVASQIVFTPSPGFYGTAMVGYTISDDNGNISNTAMATIDVLLDSDGDGLSDITDKDDDNDGVPDVTEGVADTDFDAIPDSLDVDSDNDGIPDAIESEVDTDADGIPDYIDTDSDNDGISDTIEAQMSGFDSDLDGIDDSYDVDATGGSDLDNDGVDDAIELSGTADTEGDSIPDALDVDSDNDGVPDAIEGATDTDMDGAPDYLDTDADNDGISDAEEAQLIGIDSDGDGIDDLFDADNNTGTDANGDGVDDLFAANGLVDTDGDGKPDALDLDADGDGIPDSTEGTADLDGDGVADYLNPASDIDGDGLSDEIEGSGDTDGDGVPDYLDEDSDGDGIPDSVEAFYQGEIPADKDTDSIFDYIDMDSDNDGISDLTEGYQDQDGDGVLDFRDLDVDNDGILDIIEIRINIDRVNELDANLDGVVDRSFEFGINGMADVLETTPESGIENYPIEDIDGDGVFDYRDLDSDNDGRLDTTESDHPDVDLDGIIDETGLLNDASISFTLLLPRAVTVDQTGVANAAGGMPPNTDEDALADFRDLDSDNDGLFDVIEAFSASADTNADGLFDDFVDDNADGAGDRLLAAPLLEIDTDADGFGDAEEIDSDGDGLSDLVESGLADIDGNGRVDNFVDVDSNGVDDQLFVSPVVPIDLDGDGIPNHLDLDSDGDGLSDVLESGGTDLDGDGTADEPSLSAALPDLNINGIPDVLEAKSEIHTGLSGSGCSIATSSAKATVDPSLPGLILFAAGFLLLRRSRTSL